jgi:hypothetical protein
VAQKSVNMTVPQIPNRPSGLPPRVDATVDPTIKIGEVGLVAAPGDVVPVAVRLMDDPHGLTAAVFTVQYDTTLLDLSNQDVTIASNLKALGWCLAANVDDAYGVVYLSLYGMTPLPSGPQDLLALAFHVPANAKAGTSPLGISGELNEGQLVLTTIDGSIIVRAPVGSTLAGKRGAAGAARDAALAQYAALATMPDRDAIASTRLPATPSPALVDHLMADNSRTKTLLEAGLMKSAGLAPGKMPLQGGMALDDLLPALMGGRHEMKPASVGVADDILSEVLDWNLPVPTPRG